MGTFVRRPDEVDNVTERSLEDWSFEASLLPAIAGIFEMRSIPMRFLQEVDEMLTIGHGFPIGAMVDEFIPCEAEPHDGHCMQRHQEPTRFPKEMTAIIAKTTDDEHADAHEASSCASTALLANLS